MNPLKLLGAPLREIVDSVGGIIDKVSTTEEEKLAAKKQLWELERKFHAQVLEAEAEIVRARADVVKAEASSESWLTSNWRPIVMLGFAYIVFHVYVLAPIFPGLPNLTIEPKMWELLELGIGGYVIGRSVEKIAPSITEVIVESRKK